VEHALPPRTVSGADIDAEIDVSTLIHLLVFDQDNV
jgi:hypothetical protein